MVDLAAILTAAHHRVAAVGLQKVDGDLLLVARVDLVDNMGQKWIDDAVVEAAGELRSVAEGVQPEADGAGREDTLSRHVTVEPPGGFVLDGRADIDGPSPIACGAVLAHDDGHAGDGRRGAEDKGGSQRNSRDPRPCEEGEGKPE